MLSRVPSLCTDVASPAVAQEQLRAESHSDCGITKKEHNLLLKERFVGNEEQSALKSLAIKK